MPHESYKPKLLDVNYVPKHYNARAHYMIPAAWIARVKVWETILQCWEFVSIRGATHAEAIEAARLDYPDLVVKADAEQ